MRVFWLSLLFSVVGVGMGIYANYLVHDLLRVSRVWSGGVAAEGEVELEGEVTTHTFILKDYELEATFDHEGEPVTVDAEFMRFFTGPGRRDPFELRYLPGDPSQAVISWQREGLVHGWIWASLAGGLSILMLSGIVYLIVTVRGEVGLALELARAGELHRLPVQELKSQGSVEAPELVVHFLAPGQVAMKQKFELKRGEPCLLSDGGEVLALVSVDGRRAFVVQLDGHPLRELPPLPS